MSQVSLLFKDRILSIFQLHQHQDAIIGNDPECQIFIDSLAISPHHAKIYFDDNYYVLEELENTTNILVNGRKVDMNAKLSDGDRITVGKHTLAFTFDERNESHDDFKEPSKPAKKEQRVGWIQYLNGDNLGKTIQIKNNMTNVADDNEQNIALISNRKDGFYISYLQGDQPPRINNNSIGEKSVKLEDNNRISIGAQELLFYLD